MKRMVFLIALALTFSFSFAGAKTVGDALEVSRRNLKGHESLYNEGWFVVTSASKAIDSARQNSFSASQAMRQALENSGARASAYPEKMGAVKKLSLQTASSIKTHGDKNSERIFSANGEIAQAQWEFSKKQYANAYSRFTMGYLQLGEKTASDWDRIREVNQSFAQRTAHPFSGWEMKLLLENTFEEVEKKADEAVWSKALSQADDEFNQSYEESGESHNSLTALGGVMWGHLKAFYYGLVKPSAISASNGVATAANAVGRGSTLVLASAIAVTKISGDVVYTTGMNLYYVTRAGYHVVAPTVEAGLLGSLALASTVSTAIVAGSGATLGAMNVVAVNVASPVVAGTQAAVASTAETAQTSLAMVYDVAKGSGQALAHGGSAGVALGTAALTQIPSQTALGVANGAVFLVYDGPRLALMSVRGEIDGVPASEIPAGTVMNVKALESQGLKAEKIEVSPEVMEKVFEKAPQDFRTKDQK